MKLLFTIGTLVLAISLINAVYAQTEKTLLNSEGIKVVGNDTVISGNVTNGQLYLSIDNGTLSFLLCSGIEIGGLPLECFEK